MIFPSTAGIYFFQGIRKNKEEKTMEPKGEQGKTVRIMVGEREFSLNRREFDLLASSIEAKTGMDLEVPLEFALEEDGESPPGEAG